jgi:aspartyl-tRNA(Asn)/glutamyl-tRNA(Gln) amidotransferase subunit C
LVFFICICAACPRVIIASLPMRANRLAAAFLMCLQSLLNSDILLEARDDGGEVVMSNSNQEISRETFDHLVELAALELGQEESEYLHTQLNHQLAAVHILEAIDISADVPPASHGVPFPEKICPALRKDEWDACPDSDAIIKQAPVVDDGFIIVPDIPHRTLE